MLLKLRIEDVADTGQGLARVDGFVHFVSSGLPGDVILAELVEKKKNYAVCKTLELLEPSDLRRDEHRFLLQPPFGLDLMPLREEVELELKEKKVRTELAKALGPALEEARFNPIIGMEERSRYRNKAVFPFRYVAGRNVCGAFERLSHNIVEVGDNPSMPLSFARINEVLIAWMGGAGLKCYDEAAHRGTLRYATLRVNDRGEHLILLTVKEDGLPDVADLVQRLEAAGVSVKGLLKTVKEERGNTPYGRKVELLYGSDRLEDRVGDARFSLSVKSFFQVSREGCEKLYNEVYRLSDLDSVRSLWDVYCGVGSIGLYLLTKHRAASSSANCGACAAPHAEADADSFASHAEAGSCIPHTEAGSCGPAPTCTPPPASATSTESHEPALSPAFARSIDSQQASASGLTSPVSCAAEPCGTAPIQLWGLEAVEEAVKDASLNAALNGIPHAEFAYGLAEKALAMRFKSHRAPDLLIVDPPRKGLERSAVDAIMKAAPERIIYVSCKVSTLARDLKLFTEAGYELREVTPVNLFPMTMHVETVALLTRVHH